MYEAVKPGGFLIVQGFVNEALHEEWQGFHQHNIDLDKEGTVHANLHVSDRKGWVFSVFNPYFARKIHIDLLGRDWLIFIVRKPLEV
jgi:hypothetical protein